VTMRHGWPPPDQVGRFYDDFDTTLLHFGYWDRFPDPSADSSMEAAMRRLTDQVIQRLGIGAGDWVLDVGCGIGAPAMQIAHATGAEIVGITVSGDQVEQARKLAEREELAEQVTFHQADAMDPPFDDESFDAVYALESVQHMNRTVALRQMARLVQPGGRIVLTDLFQRSSGRSAIIDRLVQVWMLSSPVATFDGYPSLVEQAGLELIELRDITPNVIPGTFGTFAADFGLGMSSGERAELFPSGIAEVQDPDRQRVVLEFTEELARAEDLGVVTAPRQAVRSPDRPATYSDRHRAA
jgi:O-methyltransferase StaMB